MMSETLASTASSRLTSISSFGQICAALVLGAVAFFSLTLAAVLSSNEQPVSKTPPAKLRTVLATTLARVVFRIVIPQLK